MDKDLFLPKGLMMLVAVCLSDYDLAKLYQCSGFFLECVQAHYRRAYGSLLRQMVGGESEGERIALEEQGVVGRSQDWRLRYAEVVTRRAFRLNGGYLRVNPHEQVRADVIAEEVVPRTQMLRQVLHGGKFNAQLTCQGELTLTVVAATQMEGEPEDSKIGEPAEQKIVVPQRVAQAAIGGQDLAFIDAHGLAFSITAVTETVQSPNTEVLIG